MSAPETDKSHLIGFKPYAGAETTDGELIPSSYAAQAVYGLAQFAYAQVLSAGVQIKDGAVSHFTTILAGLVQQAQEFLVSELDWQDGSNTRARSAVFTYVEQNPPPFGADEAAIRQWIETGVRHSRAMLRTGALRYSAGPITEEEMNLAIERFAAKTGKEAA